MVKWWHETAIDMKRRGLSGRQIAKNLGIGKSTVNDFFKSFSDVKSDRKSICVIADTQVKPNLDLTYLEVVGKYIAEKKPDVIVHIGDHWDMPSLSSYDRGTRGFEGRRVIDDIEAGHAGMRALVGQWKGIECYNPRMIFTTGNHECLTGDAEVLTTDGFVNIKELTTNHTVATMRDGGMLDWKKPNTVFSKQYDGLMNRYSSRSFYLDCTEGHRTYTVNGSGNIVVRESKDLPENFGVITSVNQDVEYCMSDDEIRLAAWLCTDSHHSASGSIRLYQRESNAQHVRDILIASGVKWSERTRVREITQICGRVLKNPPEASVEFYLDSRTISVDVSSNKTLPSWAKNLSNRQFDLFLKELVNADGTIPTKAVNSLVFYGALRICEDLQMCAVIHGWSATITEYRDGHYRVNLCHRNTRKQEGIVKEVYEYSGLVYCMTIENENFIVRQGGKCHVTGNCRLDRAANSQSELTGLLGVAQLEIEQYGWEVIEYLKPVEIDGIFFCHYLANPMSGKPYSGSALNQLKTVGRSFVVGHKQVLDVAIRPTIDGKQQIGIINGACLTPDHKILTSDLRYIPLGDVKVGDEVVSVDECAAGNNHRRFKTGKVLAHKIEKDIVYKVTLSDGTEFKVTDDHKWLVKTGSKYLWKETNQLRKGTHITKALDTWETLNTYDAGWLSGIYDGEGTYSVRASGNSVCAQMAVYQKEGLVLNKMKQVMNDIGFLVNSSVATNRNCAEIKVQGGVKNIAKLLGMLRPVRLLNKFKPEHLGRLKTTDTENPTVVSIEKIGDMDVVRIHIDEATMVVDGFVHHNCYPHFEDYKGHVGNNHFRGITFLHEVKDGFGLPMFVSLDYLFEKYAG